ncbi:MAG: hypothetical protein N2663_03870 [Chlorobi bacterium]|nr:hypothetical protein [Chlorobiota bacterium]
MKRMPKILRIGTIATLVGIGVPSQAQTLTTSPLTIVSAAAHTTIVPFGSTIIPGSLRAEDSSAAAAWVVPSRWGLRELSTVHALLHLRSNTWSGAITLSSLPMDRYTELTASTLGAFELSERLIAAIAAEYTFARARGFAAEHLVTVNAHMIFTIDSGTAIGLAATNLGQTRRDGAQSGAVSHLRVGLGHRLTHDLSADADAVLLLRMPAGMSIALRWDATPWLVLRAAYATIPQSAEASVQLRAFNGIAIIATVPYHITLGASPTIGVAYRW